MSPSLLVFFDRRLGTGVLVDVSAGVFFLVLDDLRFEEADEGFEASLEGPAESLGLDIAAEGFAFLR